jgi:hypothetical protein
MAQGLFSGTNTNPSVARPTEPTISGLSTSLDTSDITITFSPAIIGPTATSYIGLATTGETTVSATTTSTSTVTVTGATAGTHTVTMKAQNANGQSGRATTASTTAVVISYAVGQAFTSTGTYTIPSGKNYLAAFVSGAGAAGNSGNQTNSIGGGAGNGGTGGGGSGVGWIKHIPVTSGEIYSVTVGAGGNVNAQLAANYQNTGATGVAGNAGGSSILTSPNSVALATANGGSGTSGGNFTTNINTAGFASTSIAGGNGGNGGGVPGNAGTAGNSGGTGNLTLAGVSPITVQGGGAGGGGHGGHQGGTPGNSSPAAASGGTAGGGAGARTTNYEQRFAGTAGTAAGVTSNTYRGAGGGGGGGGAGNNSQLGLNTNYQGAGGTGGTGYVAIFIA